MQNNNIDNLRRDLWSLRTLKNDSSRLEHAVFTYEPSQDSECWVPFVPTKFMYSMFTFNMLYNVNWPESIERGEIIEFDSGHRDKTQGVPESEKMSSYLRFCFSDTDFVKGEKDWYIETVLGDMTFEELMESLSRIERDRDIYGRINWNGNIRAVSFISDFQKAVRSVLENRRFTEDNIHTIYNFIYKIRCNMFHGVKTITEMMDPEQQTRLEIYSRFLYAANTMVFSYLDYLDTDGMDEE